MTWEDIKLATLQKMFSADGNTIPTDDSTKDYIAAMPQAANEALLLLSTSNKYLRQYVEVSAEPSEDSDGLTEFYDMSYEADDFYSLGTPEIYLVDGTRLKSVSNYTVRSGKYISFVPPKSGIYQIFYNAWPAEITADTQDTYTLPVAREVGILLPLYMASQLYKDDDIQIATMYRNEFETGRAALQPEKTGTQMSRFVSESGWV